MGGVAATAAAEVSGQLAPETKRTPTASSSSERGPLPRDGQPPSLPPTSWISVVVGVVARAALNALRAREPRSTARPRPAK